MRESQFRRPPKIVHRTHPQVRIRQPHPVDIWIDQGGSPRDGLVGRPVRRAREAHSEATELELLLAPIFSIGVLHFPVRSLKQYTRLVGIAVANGDLGRDEETRRVRDAYQAGRLEEIYREMAFEDDEIGGGIEAGRPGAGHGLSRLPAGVPGPAQRQDGTRGAAPTCWAGRPSGASTSWRSCEADGMYTLSRYLQTIAYRRLSDRRAAAPRRAERRSGWRKSRRAGGGGMRPRVSLRHPAACGWRRWSRLARGAGGARPTSPPPGDAPRVKLAMTLIVRNEADIIEDNLRYHRAQGVDFFIVLDNGSTDGTLEILESLRASRAS